MVEQAGRKRRRVGFAAPLVLITACGQAPPAAVPVEAPVAGLEQVAIAEPPPVDAAVDAPVDAAPDAPARRGNTLTVELWIQPEGFASCHNFGPTNRGCNPPRPYQETREVKILEVEAVDGGTRMLILLGTKDGLEPRGGPVTVVRPSGHTAKLSRITTRSSQLEVSLDRDQIMAGELHVKIR